MTAPQPASPPPVTGVPRIDDALTRLRLDPDVATHPAELTAALEVLQRALNSPADQQ